MYAIINQKLVPIKEAVLPINDLSIQRGYGAFDFFRTQNGVPLFIEDHLDRLQQSAKALDLTIPFSTADLRKQVAQLMQQHQFPCSGIRITVTGGLSPDMYSVGIPNVIITEQPLTMQGTDTMHSGFRVITHEHVRELPQIKSINYLTGVWMQPKVKAAGVDDVLFVKDGYISELPRSNVFVINKDGILITPSENILHGITRKKVLSIARETMRVEVRPVGLNELMEASEAFITSTTKRIVPMIAVNGIKIGNGLPGVITEMLFRSFMNIEEQYFVHRMNNY